MSDSLPEPWLRGPVAGVDPLLMPMIHALQQAHEDLHWHTECLSDSQLWTSPHGLTPLGFHLRHIAGSLDRLTTYLENRGLDAQQFAFLEDETVPGASGAELLRGIDAAIERATAVIRHIDMRTLTDARSVGRKQLPTTVIGLAVHLAEHTQRHVGQAITTSMLLKRIAAEHDERS